MLLGGRAEFHGACPPENQCWKHEHTTLLLLPLVYHLPRLGVDNEADLRMYFLDTAKQHRLAETGAVDEA